MQPDFNEIFERFDDDETALCYIWEDAFIKGLFVGIIITTFIFSVLS
jgi:hypothetical protein